MVLLHFLVVRTHYRPGFEWSKSTGLLHVSHTMRFSQSKGGGGCAVRDEAAFRQLYPDIYDGGFTKYFLTAIRDILRPCPLPPHTPPTSPRQRPDFILLRKSIPYRVLIILLSFSTVPPNPPQAGDGWRWDDGNDDDVHLDKEDEREWADRRIANSYVTKTRHSLSHLETVI
jgi:hypothetical protein